MESEANVCHVFRKIITVGVVTSFRSQFLASMLEALISQLVQYYDEVELFLVVDGYDEDTIQVIEKYKYTNACVRYVINQKNEGRPKSRNRVVSEARGTYILWIDDDDIPFQDLIKTHLDVIKEDPSVDVAYIDLEVYDIKSKKVLGILSAPNVRALGSMLYERLFFGYGLPSIGSIIRRSLYLEVGGFDELFIRAQDAEFWFRIVHKARFHKIDKVLYRYNQHSESISTQKKDDYSFISFAILKTLGRVPLDEILPHLHWEDPSRALSQAYLFLARAFKHNGDFYNCYRFIMLVPIEHLAVEDMYLLIQSAFIIGAGRSVKGKIESLGLMNKIFATEVINELLARYTIFMKLEEKSKAYFHAGIRAPLSELEEEWKKYLGVDPLCILEIKAKENASHGNRAISRKMYEACLRYAPENDTFLKKCSSLGNSDEEKTDASRMKERIQGSRIDGPLYFISPCKKSGMAY